MPKPILPKPILPIAILIGALAACAEPASEVEDESTDTPPAVTARQAVADVQLADGAAAGEAMIAERDGTLEIAVTLRNLPPGAHGVHVHQTGVCEAPDFTSAGGHWNPVDQAHGLEDPAGQHAGDMPNLTVGEDGTGTLVYPLEGGAEFDRLMDADGAALVVHAGRDDQMTDPAGDAGDRIACGVFTAAA